MQTEPNPNPYFRPVNRTINDQVYGSNMFWSNEANQREIRGGLYFLLVCIFRWIALNITPRRPCRTKQDTDLSFWVSLGSVLPSLNGIFILQTFKVRRCVYQPRWVISDSSMYYISVIWNMFLPLLSHSRKPNVINPPCVSQDLLSSQHHT